MNEYPALAQAAGTTMIERQSVLDRFATNGALRQRLLSSHRRYDITVVHDLISDAERVVLETFYASIKSANKIDPFNFTALEDGVQRRCYFAPQPYQIDPVPGMPGYFRATVYLREE